jgi:hypothetical protein
MSSGTAARVPPTHVDFPPGPWLRLRVRAQRLKLDRGLAGGLSPLESKELKVRAQQLGSERTRGKLAKSLARIVSRAEDKPGRQLGRWGLAFSGPQVLASRDALVRIRERLTGPGPHSLRGVAMVSVLVSDAGSPLYMTRRPGDLSRALDQIDSAL